MTTLETFSTSIPKFGASTETQELESDWPEENAGMQKICLSRLSEGQDDQDLASNAASKLRNRGSIHGLLQEMIKLLKEAGIEEATQNAELILQEVLGLKNRSAIYLNRKESVSESAIEQALAFIHQRSTGSPLQYLLGHTEFFGLKLWVNRHVLIPRPETEMLVEKALSWLQKNPERNHILDIGTGSGNIAIALAKNAPQSRILAIDLSQNALKVAEENIRTHHVQSQIKLEACDFTKLTPQEPFDMVIANPPYIPEEAWENLPIEVKLEPRTALLSGEKGLKNLTQIIERAPLFLKSNGALLMEFGGEHQTPFLLKTLSEAGFHNMTVSKDLAGKDRVVQAVFEKNSLQSIVNSPQF